MNIDVEVINFIKGQILCNPNVEAGEVWRISRLAEKDVTTYSLMVKWMEATDPVERDNIYQDLIYREKTTTWQILH